MPDFCYEIYVLNNDSILALLGKQPENNLLHVMKCLVDLECYTELANFISWAFTHFSDEVREPKNISLDYSK